MIITIEKLDTSDPKEVRQLRAIAEGLDSGFLLPEIPVHGETGKPEKVDLTKFVAPETVSFTVTGKVNDADEQFDSNLLAKRLTRLSGVEWMRYLIPKEPETVEIEIKGGDDMEIAKTLLLFGPKPKFLRGNHWVALTDDDLGISSTLWFSRPEPPEKPENAPKPAPEPLQPTTPPTPETADSEPESPSKSETEPEPRPEPPKPPEPVKKNTVVADQETIQRLEKKIRKIRKPRGAPRPERAPVNGAPGECLKCDHAAATLRGWFCQYDRNDLFALAVDAVRCDKFIEGLPGGESVDLEPEIGPVKHETAPQSPPAPEPDPTPPAPETDDSEPESPAPEQIREKAREMERIALDHAIAEAAKQNGVKKEAPIDPDSFFDETADDPSEPKALREAVRAEARLCTSIDKIRDRVSEVLAAYSKTGPLSGIPDDKLAACLEALRALRG